MSISSPAGDNFASPARRDEFTRKLKQWCAAASLPGRRGPLSDDALLLIAISRLPEELRGRLLRRIEQGEYPPVIPTGIAALQADIAELRELDAKLGPNPGLLYWNAKTLRDTLRLTVSAARSRFGDAPSWNPRGFRSKTKAQAAGTYIYPQERLALFDEIGRSMVGFKRGDVATSRDAVGGAPPPENVVIRWTERAASWVNQISVGSAGGHGAASGEAGRKTPQTLAFRDAYETLNYLAGGYYQDIRLSRVWYTQYFDALRGQVSLERELVHISVDIADLRALVQELDHPAAGHGFSAAEVRRRKGVLKTVWDQLVERVAALARIADLVARTGALLDREQGMRAEAALDRRIDELVGRAGDRELGADNLHRMGDSLIEVQAMIDAQQWALAQDIGILQRRSEF